MPYGKKLYKNNSRVYASDIIYDETEEKLQSEINANVKADVDILKDHDGVITGEKTYSGSVATILDAEYEMPLKSCVVDIEPVQDLHGYDHPWPAGGGKNRAVISSATIQKPSWYQGGWSGVSVNNNNGITQTKGYNDGGAGGFVISLSEGVYTASLTYNGNESCVIHIVSWNGTESTTLCDNVTMIKNGERFAYSFTVPAGSIEISIRPTKNGSAQGAPYNLDDIQVEEGSTATAYAPYSNICPISGWTGCNVSRTGKNLFNIVLEQGGFDAHGADVSTTNAVRSKGFIEVGLLTETVLTINALSLTSNIQVAVAVYTSNDPATNTKVFDSSWQNISYSFTFPASAKYFRVTIRKVPDGAIVPSEVSNIQIELGSTATAYEPYSGTTIPISWQSSAGTVYGGTLDVTTGALTVDRAMVTYDGSVDEDWTQNQTYTYSIYYTPNPTGLDKTKASICNQFKAGVLGTENGSFFIGSYINFTTNVANNTEAWMIYLQSNPLEFVYHLTTPIVIQLDAHTIETLLGQNNIWADTGDISVSYGGLISVIDRSIDTLTDRLDNLKADQIKAKGMGEVEAEPGDIVTVTDAAEFPVKDLKVKIEPIQDLHGKANPYPVLEKEPYLFRQSGGSQNSEVNGYAHDILVGGTVCWNQIQKRDRATNTTANVTYTNNNDGSFTLNGTANANSFFSPANGASSAKSVANHIYLAVTDIVNPSNNSLTVGMYINSTLKVLGDTHNSLLYKATTTGDEIQMGFRWANGANFSLLKVKGYLIDLTQMFGSTIADRAYALEQATAGSGIAWLKSMGFFTQDYYPYDAGTLKSVEGLQSHDMVGKNLLPENTITITNNNYEVLFDHILPPGEYTLSFSSIRSTDTDSTKCILLFVYDDGVMSGIHTFDRNVAQTRTFTFPSGGNIKSIVFYASDTYSHGDGDTAIWEDVQFELNSTATIYEPYVKHSYPLDSDLTLRGIPKLDANNKLYYDGDTYAADGSVIRKYGMVDLGSLDWNYSSGSAYFGSTTALSNGKQTLNAISAIYPEIFTSWNAFTGYTDGNALYIDSSNPKVYIKNPSYTDAATFKTAMSGVYLVYELATPTTETADPFQTPQICDKAGTEEYVTTGIVPVGHSTTYGNICPIEGRTGCNVTKTGFNVWDEEWEGGRYDNSGQKALDSGRIRSKNYIPCLPSKDYYIYINGHIGNWSAVYFYDSNQNFISYATPSASTNIFTTPSNCAYLNFFITDLYGTTYNNDICINLSNLAKNGIYEPYFGTTIPVSWQSEAGTVYGGTLDVTSGVLTVTMAEVDLETLTWTYNSTKEYFSALVSIEGKEYGYWVNSNAKCSNYAVKSRGNVVDGKDEGSITINISAVYVHDSRYTDAATFKSAMSGVQLIYELATPQTYQLTPTQVTLLQGYNNIWSDVGPIESLTYLGTEATNVQNEIDEFENKLSGIQKSISSIQDDMTAIRNYEPNEFVTVGKNLYIITTNISKGVSLIEGTNCRETTVMEQITNLLNIIASQNS